MREYPQTETTMRWVLRGSAIAMLLIGWAFILITNNFHITPPVVFVCLGYFAGVAAIYTLYRLGATAVSETNEEDDAMSWVKPLGALDELEREKRALLKAIKEAEFDQQMGKLSKADAESMIGVYRARAIEVIKEIDVQNSTSGKAGTVRDRILREARARAHVEDKVKDVPAKKSKKAEKADKKQALADKLAEGVAVAMDAAEKVRAAEPEDVLEGAVDDKPVLAVVDHGDVTLGEALDRAGILRTDALDDDDVAHATAEARRDLEAAREAVDKAAAASTGDQPAAATTDDEPAVKADDKADKAADDKAAAKADDKPAAKAADKPADDKPATDTAGDKPAAKEATS